MFNCLDCMKIYSTTVNNYSSFKSATININAFSDTHGELVLANSALEEMRKNQKDIFCFEDKGEKNILAICGDWFMDGGKTGYEANPQKKLGHFQKEMLIGFIDGVKEIAKNTVALFTPGNHEFDGGVSLLDDVMSELDAKIVMTNLNIPKSTGLNKTINENKLFNEYILEVEDDKVYKTLFLGISPVNLLFYQKNLSGIKLINNMIKPQAKVNKEDYEKTLEDCKKRIADFKKENPKGIVILMSHTGVEFADNLAKEAPVDLVFDGHEHKDKLRESNGTPIVPLSMNFKKIINAKLNIDDEGNLKSIDINDIYPDKTNYTGILGDLHKSMFKEDLKEKYAIKSADKDINVLSLNGIREGNNYLANFVTDSVLEELRKKDKTINFFALNSSAIRHSLNLDEKPCVSPFDVMNVLVGIKEEDGKIMTTDLNGEDIVYMVLDNIIFNNENPKKNPLIQYAGLEVNKTEMLKAYNNGADLSELAVYVKDVKNGKPVDINAKYRIANVEKYFNKSQNPQIRAIKHISNYTGDIVQDLFKQHFENSDGYLSAKLDVRVL